MSTATASPTRWAPPAYQAVNTATLSRMNRDELLERKGDLERLVRRYRTMDPEYA